MDRFIGIINVCNFFLVVLFIPIMLLPQTTVGYVFLKYFITFVVYIVSEYATILTMNDEILDIRPKGKIFKTVKLKPFFSWFIYDYDYRIGAPLLTVCIQFLVLPVVCIWFIGLCWLTVKCVSGSFWNVVENWKNIDSTVFVSICIALIITNIIRYTLLIFCVCKKYPKARSYFWGTKFDWAAEREYRKSVKDLEWQCAVRSELKKNCPKKYKGRVFIYQKTLDKLEIMVSEKYPKANMERTYDENKKYIWRVYYGNRMLFQALIRKK